MTLPFSRRLLLGLIGCLGLLSLQAQDRFVYQGRAQGTTYHVIGYGGDTAGIGAELAMLFESVNAAVSAYHPGSELLTFNAEGRLKTKNPHFQPVFRAADQMYRRSEGAFDPTVMPLVQAWGFGPDGPAPPPEAALDSLRDLVNWPAIRLQESGDSGWMLTRDLPGLALDFNGIAQGHTVDVIARRLQARGCDHFMVELGGEVRCRGRNADGRLWRIGIERPDEGPARSLSAVATLQDQALATSGSYRNFYWRDGRRYAHIIDPRTGWPVQHPLLSVTVIAPSAAEADGFATAFMVLGEGPARELIHAHPEWGLQALFISTGPGGEYQLSWTTGFPLAE